MSMKPRRAIGHAAGSRRVLTALRFVGCRLSRRKSPRQRGAEAFFRGVRCRCCAAAIRWRELVAVRSPLLTLIDQVRATAGAAVPPTPPESSRSRHSAHPGDRSVYLACRAAAGNTRLRWS